MKKEKKVRTYQRRTKSGKTITVRAHTASYEAADKAKEVAKKKGAGDEFSSKVKKGEEWKLPMDEFLKKLKDERAKKREDEEPKKVEDEKPKKKSEKKSEKKTPAKNATKKRTVGTGTNGPEPKKKTTTKKTAVKEDASEPAFTRDEFKEWYRGTGSAADKKVAKALRKQLGRSGYRKFEDEAINNYTSRGHLLMFKRVSGGSSTSAKTKNASVSRTSAKDKGSIDKGSKHYSDEGSTRKNVAKEVALGSMSREKAYALTGLKKYAPKVTTSTKTSKTTKVSSASSFMDGYKDMNALREYASQVMDSTAPYKAKTRKELKRMFDADQGKTGSHEKKFKKFLKDEWLPNKGNVKGDRNFYLGTKSSKASSKSLAKRWDTTPPNDKMDAKARKADAPKSEAEFVKRLKNEAGKSRGVGSVFNSGTATYRGSVYDLYKKRDTYYAVNRKTGKLATDSMTAKIMASPKK